MHRNLLIKSHANIIEKTEILCGVRTCTTVQSPLWRPCTWSKFTLLHVLAIQLLALAKCIFLSHAFASLLGIEIIETVQSVSIKRRVSVSVHSQNTKFEPVRTMLGLRFSCTGDKASVLGASEFEVILRSACSA